MTNDDIELQAGEAVINRLWWHSIGIVNEVRLPGTLPDGRGADEEQPGAGCAVRWGHHRCVLTAKHVIEGAGPETLRLFARPTDKLDRISMDEIRKRGFVEAYTGVRPAIQDVHRCPWEDLAVIVIDSADVSLNAEFHDIASAHIDPAEGMRILNFGFPSDRALDKREGRVGDREFRARLLTPAVWDTVVLKSPLRFVESSFEKYPFNSERHFLAAWNPADRNAEPHGLSGGAVWTVAAGQRGELWSPKVLFGGICTHYYKSRKAERIVKASAVKAFLEQVFDCAVEGSNSA